MSRVHNADEFRLALRRARQDYERVYGPQIAAIRGKYAESVGTAGSLILDESLEAHARAYIVNALLGALNWRLDTDPLHGLPNLVPEVPLKSQEKGTTRFLDYLGLERATNAPLLIVETKRPRSGLPGLADYSKSRPAATYAEVISRGLLGEPLEGDWSKWVSTVTDYVRSVQARAGEFPKRGVITNGDWMIVFVDVPDAFGPAGTCNPNCILVFADRDSIDRRCGELFCVLEHGAVSRETPAFTIGELRLMVSGAEVDRLMHGLHLRYGQQVSVYHARPGIAVAPTVLLRTRQGAWVRVEERASDFEIPHQRERLLEHLIEVDSRATQLRQEVNSLLGTTLEPATLGRHYEDDEAFGAVPGVVEITKDDFLVVTGNRSHYLLPEPSVALCPHHDWNASHAAGVATDPPPIADRSVEPRSFFVSGELHHCSHRQVFDWKARPVTATNRARCGPRSGDDGQAFCEVWQFETHLCCRACAFEEVCVRADVFHLPWSHPSPL